MELLLLRKGLEADCDFLPAGNHAHRQLSSKALICCIPDTVHGFTDWDALVSWVAMRVYIHGTCINAVVLQCLVFSMVDDMYIVGR